MEKKWIKPQYCVNKELNCDQCEFFDKKIKQCVVNKDNKIDHSNTKKEK